MKAWALVCLLVAVGCGADCDCPPIDDDGGAGAAGASGNPDDAFVCATAGATRPCSECDSEPVWCARAVWCLPEGVECQDVQHLDPCWPCHVEGLRCEGDGSGNVECVERE